MTHSHNPATQKVVPKDAVVLDIDAAVGHMSGGRGDLPALLTYMREQGIFASKIADQIEAQTKPPRIPEPDVALAEVEASTASRERRRFVRGFGSEVREARWVDGVFSYSWDELIDPVLIRDGIEESS